jgi:hypothetical protein
MAKGRHSGRPSSWLAVGTMIAAFIIGGIALTIGPTWPMFWAGVAVFAVGGVLALVVDIFSDVVMDGTREMPEGIGQRLVTRRGGRPAMSSPEQGDPEQTPHG